MAEMGERAGGAPSSTVDGGPVQVRVRDLTQRFATDEGAMTALDGIDLDVHANEFVSLLGPSGCGKTTLLRIIGGLIEATRGEISVDGARSRMRGAPGGSASSSRTPRCCPGARSPTTPHCCWT